MRRTAWVVSLGMAFLLLLASGLLIRSHLVNKAKDASDLKLYQEEKIVFVNNFEVHISKCKSWLADLNSTEVGQTLLEDHATISSDNFYNSAVNAEAQESFLRLSKTISDCLVNLAELERLERDFESGMPHADKYKSYTHFLHECKLSGCIRLSQAVQPFGDAVKLATNVEIATTTLRSSSFEKLIKLQEVALSGELMFSGRESLRERGAYYGLLSNVQSEIDHRISKSETELRELRKANWEKTKTSPFIISSLRQYEAIMTSDNDGAAVLLLLPDNLPVQFNPVGGVKEDYLKDFNELTLIEGATNGEPVLEISMNKTLSDGVVATAGINHSANTLPEDGTTNGNKTKSLPFILCMFLRMQGGLVTANSNVPSRLANTHSIQIKLSMKPKVGVFGQLFTSEYDSAENKLRQSKGKMIARRVFVIGNAVENKYPEFHSASLKRKCIVINQEKIFETEVFLFLGTPTTHRVAQKLNTEKYMAIIDDMAQLDLLTLKRSSYAGVLANGNNSEISAANQEIETAVDSVLFNSESFTGNCETALRESVIDKSVKVSGLKRDLNYFSRGSPRMWYSNVNYFLSGVMDRSGTLTKLMWLSNSLANQRDNSRGKPNHYANAFSEWASSSLVFAAKTDNGIALLGAADVDNLIRKVWDHSGKSSTGRSDVEDMKLILSEIDSYQPKAYRPPNPTKPAMPRFRKPGRRTISYVDRAQLNRDRSLARSSGDMSRLMELVVVDGVLAAENSGSSKLQGLFSSSARTRASRYRKEKTYYDRGYKPSGKEIANYKLELARWGVRVKKIERQWLEDQADVESRWPQKKQDILILLEEFKSHRTEIRRLLKMHQVQFKHFINSERDLDEWVPDESKTKARTSKHEVFPFSMFIFETIESLSATPPASNRPSESPSSKIPSNTIHIPVEFQGQWILHVISEDEGKTTQPAGKVPFMNVTETQITSQYSKDIGEVIAVQNKKNGLLIGFKTGKVFVVYPVPNDPDNFVKITVLAAGTGKEILRFLVTIQK